MNIVLAGMPGSGKSTVAAVFEKRGKTVVDTDAEIVKKHGSISDIFSEYGEEYFRALEADEVVLAAGLQAAVISTGGGCLMRRENVLRLKMSGKIVYLRTSPETLIERLSGDNSRPLLANDLRSGIYKLYAERASVYEGIADIVIDTDSLTAEEIADIIAEKI